MIGASAPHSWNSASSRYAYYANDAVLISVRLGKFLLALSSEPVVVVSILSLQAKLLARGFLYRIFTQLTTMLSLSLSPQASIRGSADKECSPRRRTPLWRVIGKIGRVSLTVALEEHPPFWQSLELMGSGYTGVGSRIWQFLQLLRYIYVRSKFYLVNGACLTPSSPCREVKFQKIRKVMMPSTNAICQNK